MNIPSRILITFKHYGLAKVKKHLSPKGMCN